MANDVCENIEKDEFYQKFLKNDDASESSALETGLAINEQIQKLSDGVDLLAKQLQKQVREQHNALLLEARNANQLSVAVDIVTNHMNQLEIGADRLKAKINTPYEQLKNQTRVLARLHDVSHILRQSNRFLQLYQKLSADAKDVASQADILFELEFLMNNEQLRQIHFIRDEGQVVANMKQRLTNAAHYDLLNALKTATDEEKAVKSLQVFTNLQTLPKYIDDLIETFVVDVEHSIKECFTVNTEAKKLSTHKAKANTAANDGNRVKASPGGIQNMASAQQFPAKLWSSLEWLFGEKIYKCWKQVNFLAKCLKKVSQHPTNVGLLQTINIEKHFNERLNVLLHKSFNDCSVYVKQCLIKDLPKLLQLSYQLQSKCENRSILSSDKIFGTLEAKYLEQCANNFKTAIATLEATSPESVDAYIQVVHKEFRNISGDGRLSGAVSAIFVACSKEFWSKYETNVKLSGDAEQVLDLPNAFQHQNIALANTIFDYTSSMKALVRSLGNEFTNSRSAQNILDSLQHGTKIAMKILKQLAESMKSASGIILLSMHREPGLNSDRAISVGPSLYMKELQDFLYRAWNHHVAPFKDKSLIESYGKELAETCVELFLYNIAIIRPISQSGRQRLQYDCQHLENALNPLVGDFSKLSRTYRMLRTLSGLVTLTPEQLSKSSLEVDGPISPFIVLLLLFGFAANDLASPHTAAGWSNEKIVEWLMTHVALRERLELVSGALQKYRNFVRQKNVIKYDPIYPILSSYLEAVQKSIVRS